MRWEEGLMSLRNQLPSWSKKHRVRLELMDNNNNNNNNKSHRIKEDNPREVDIEKQNMMASREIRLIFIE